MRESKLWRSILDEGEKMGALRVARKNVLAVIAPRLANPVPEEVRLAVEGTNAPDILSQWLLLSVTCPSLEDFVQHVSRKNGAAASA